MESVNPKKKLKRRNFNLDLSVGVFSSCISLHVERQVLPARHSRSYICLGGALRRQGRLVIFGVFCCIAGSTAGYCILVLLLPTILKTAGRQRFQFYRDRGYPLDTYQDVDG